MDTDPNTLLARLTHVIEIAKCWRELYHNEVERRKALESDFEKLKEVSERNALGILAITSGAKPKR